MRDYIHWAPRLLGVVFMPWWAPLPAAAQDAARSTPPEHAQHAEDARDAPVARPIADAERAAAFPELGAMRMADMMLENPLNKLVLLDRFETQDASGGDVLSWNLESWIGRDLDKLWIRSEGERRSGDTEHAELEILWGRAFAPWWELVAGARADFEPAGDRSWAAIGVRGLAPYRLEVEATAYLGSGSRSGLRLETTYEVLVTNRLVLTPLLELNWHGQTDFARGVGAGLSDGELGLRLRYEVRREIAPYVGITRERLFGRTADLARSAGRDANDTRLVAGVRLWF
jgi:copper resistance protein B